MSDSSPSPRSLLRQLKIVRFRTPDSSASAAASSPAASLPASMRFSS
jgi:hypothetical protein